MPSWRVDMYDMDDIGDSGGTDDSDGMMTLSMALMRTKMILASPWMMRSMMLEQIIWMILLIWRAWMMWMLWLKWMPWMILRY